MGRRDPLGQFRIGGPCGLRRGRAFPVRSPVPAAAQATLAAELPVPAWLPPSSTFAARSSESGLPGLPILTRGTLAATDIAPPTVTPVRLLTVTTPVWALGTVPRRSTGPVMVTPAPNPVASIGSPTHGLVPFPITRVGRTVTSALVTFGMVTLAAIATTTCGRIGPVPALVPALRTIPALRS